MRGESQGGSCPHSSTTSTQATGTGGENSSSTARTGAESASGTPGTSVKESTDQIAS